VSEWGMDEDFVSGSGGVASQLLAVVVPAPSQKTRRNGAPYSSNGTLGPVSADNQKARPPATHCLSDAHEVKIWATRQRTIRTLPGAQTIHCPLSIAPNHTQRDRYC
jgi:hypothetical protein